MQGLLTKGVIHATRWCWTPTVVSYMASGVRRIPCAFADGTYGSLDTVRGNFFPAGSFIWTGFSISVSLEPRAKQT
jgi:hypothetical protein